MGFLANARLHEGVMQRKQGECDTARQMEMHVGERAEDESSHTHFVFQPGLVPFCGLACNFFSP